MNCDENNLLQEDLTPDDVSARSKPDDAENNKRSRKRKTNSRSEFDDLQSQVKGVSDALNNFGKIFQSFLYEAKRPKTNVGTAAQSAPTAAQSAPSAAQSAQFAAHVATPSTSF
eukprot:gene15682-6971_t